MKTAPTLRLSLDAPEASSNAARKGAIQHAVSLAIQLANGTADGAANVIWSTEKTIAGSATDSYDLRGVLESAVDGVAVDTAEIVCILLLNLDTDSDLTIGPPASNGCTSFWGALGDLNKCQRCANVNRPSIVLLFSDKGYAVTASTGDLINVIETAGNAGRYFLALIGRTA